MGIDYYAEFEQISLALAAKGLVDESRELDELVEAGATGTEIFMGVRWKLKEIDAANKVMDLELKRRIRSLIWELDRELA